ncbi:MAG: GntR family transcriptional regulator [Firmicutes bacterium]|nr:GntR family transcriptional regulator [Bacillota bacterium]
MEFDKAQPIYLQIIDQIKKALARGSLNPGDKLPSQRELALTLGVNPNTIQRVYREMEQMGLTETLRGQGTYIKQGDDLVKMVRSEMVNTVAENFINEMLALGCSKEEIMTLVKQLLDKSIKLKG